MLAPFILLFTLLLGPIGLLSHADTAAGDFLHSRPMAEQPAKLPLAAELFAQLPLPSAEVHDAVQNALNAQIKYRPYRNWSVVPPDVDARAAIIVGGDSGKVLYERNMHDQLPIASLTKLATALAVVDELELTEEVQVSKHAVSTDGDFGNLVVGETLSVHDLLRAMLITSSNDAAVALGDYSRSAKSKDLIVLMNSKASELGLANTHFASVNGLEDAHNYSTAEDVAKLFGAAYKNSVLAEILRTGEIVVHSVDGAFTHRLITSNRLLGTFDDVVAGKTGYTMGAGGSLAVLAHNTQASDDFIVVVLGSKNEDTRFEAAKTLITWVHDAYSW